MEANQNPAAEPTPAAAAPVQISAGKKQIYKQAAQNFIREVNDFIADQQAIRMISNQVYVNARSERGFAGFLRGKYIEKFLDRESEFRAFFVEAVPHDQYPGMFDEARLHAGFFRDMYQEMITPEEVFERIRTAVAWITYCAEKI